jgi:hypothetical protein
VQSYLSAVANFVLDITLEKTGLLVEHGEVGTVLLQAVVVDVDSVQEDLSIELVEAQQQLK